MKKIKLEIFGMKCQGCINTVQITLKKYPGVKKVNVNLIPSEADIICENEILPDKLIKYLEKNTQYKSLVKIEKK